MMYAKIKQVSMIGLGKMGGNFAKHLISLGKYDLKLYDISKTAMEPFRDTKAKLCSTLEEAVADSDVILTSLPDPKTVKETYTGDNGILKSVKEGATMIDLSTIDVDTAIEIENKARQRNCNFLSATVGKGPKEAEKGESPLFVGGDKEVYENLYPFLKDLGGNIYYFGSIEKSIAFKLITNLIGLSNLVILAEGYALAERIGIDAQVFKKALEDTGAKSYQSDIRLDSFINNDFSVKFALDYVVKDMWLALELARKYDFPLLVSPIIYNIYKICSNTGLGNEDAAAVIKLFRGFQKK